MRRPTSAREQRAQTLAAVLRGVRRLRGIDTPATAQLMGLERRTFERFEAGDGRLDLERILRFAERTDSDPVAIVMSLVLNRPELGVECADNKLPLILAYALERFSRARGDQIRRLDPATLIDVFEAAFEQLGRIQDQRDARAREWFDTGASRPDAER